MPGSNIIDLNGNIPKPKSDLAAGGEEFYANINGAISAAFQVSAPFQGVHPAMSNALGEVMRYLELAGMYMDKYMSYAANPKIAALAKKRGEQASAQGDQSGQEG